MKSKLWDDVMVSKIEHIVKWIKRDALTKEGIHEIWCLVLADRKHQRDEVIKRMPDAEDIRSMMFECEGEDERTGAKFFDYRAFLSALKDFVKDEIFSNMEYERK